jgi:hypothetical protein
MAGMTVRSPTGHGLTALGRSNQGRPPPGHEPAILYVMEQQWFI